MMSVVKNGVKSDLRLKSKDQCDGRRTDQLMVDRHGQSDREMDRQTVVSQTYGGQTLHKNVNQVGIHVMASTLQPRIVTTKAPKALMIFRQSQ